MTTMLQTVAVIYISHFTYSHYYSPGHISLSSPILCLAQDIFSLLLQTKLEAEHVG